MSEYLLINLGIIAVPLLLTFERKMSFYKKLPAVFVSMLLVGSVYIIWDIYAAYNFHWYFNAEYTGNIKILGLPLEEILFFITVPYAMLFLYETFIYYLKDKIRYNPDLKNSVIIIFLIFFLSAVLLMDKPYTFLVLVSCAFYFFISSSFYSDNIKSGLFWIFILFSFIPFILVNYLLTSLPVVIYNPGAIIGYRILTIPVEDFFYSFSLISFYVMAYTAFNKWRGGQKALKR
jgi:lycopene cyclase domain-containing protein